MVLEPGEEDFLAGHPQRLPQRRHPQRHGHELRLRRPARPGLDPQRRREHDPLPQRPRRRPALRRRQRAHGRLVRNNRFDSNGETGIQLFAGTEGSTVENNFFVSNGMSIHLDAARGNVIRNNEISGIIIDPELDSDAGIVVENGSRQNLLEGNDVSDTGDAGIVIHQGSHGNKVVGGVLVRNGDAGVIVQDSDRIEIDGVLAHRQSDGGVVLSNSSGSSVKNSDLGYNPAGVDASNTNGLIVDGNDVSHSLQSGIELGDGVGMTDHEQRREPDRRLGHLCGSRHVRLPRRGRRRRADRRQHDQRERGERHLVAANARHTDRAATPRTTTRASASTPATSSSPGEPPDPNANIDGGGNRASGNHADLPLARPARARPVRRRGLRPGRRAADHAGRPPGARDEDHRRPARPAAAPPAGRPGARRRSSRSPPTTAPAAPRDGDDLRVPPRRSAGPGRAAEEPELEPPDPNDPELLEPPEGEFWAECVSPLTVLEPRAGRAPLRGARRRPADNFDLTPAEYIWTVHAGVDEEGREREPAGRAGHAHHRGAGRADHGRGGDALRHHQPRGHLPLRRQRQPHAPATTSPTSAGSTTRSSTTR